MPPADLSAWKRVGPLLAARRVQISPRYANRRAFAAETGVNWRTLHDAEHAKRANFKAETLRQFESAYRLASGSLDRALAGGELEPAPASGPPPVFPEPPTAAEEALEKFPGDPVSQAIWRLPNTSAAEKWEMIAVIQGKRAEIAERRSSQAG
jgi:hypothetical protein